MEQVAKGLWLGTGIFFFLTAMVVSGMYLYEINKLADTVNGERESTYLMEAGEGEEVSDIE